MSSQPPAPSVPRQTDYTVLWIVLGVLLFAGALTFTGVYIFARYLARQITLDVRRTASGRSVDIQTPVGSMRVKAGEISEQQLGLPIYPGARHKEKKGATISLEVPSATAVQVVAAEFETDDPLEKVAAFYRERLGGSFSERSGKNMAEFVMRQGEQQKLVVVRRKLRMTEIALVNVTEARSN